MVLHLEQPAVAELRVVHHVARRDHDRHRDARGNQATNVSELSSQPFGENVLLRLDKAIYQVGDRLNVDVHTSAGMPTGPR